MKIITYLLGAGASKNALPLISEIPESINNLIKSLNTPSLEFADNETFEKLNINNQKSIRYYKNDLISDLNWLLQASINHSSIDTFAKKLFIKRNFEDLERLKIALSIFFIILQSIKKPDIRYDTFFASLLSNLSKLPEHLRIVTWNYDYQIEKTFSQYSDSSDITTNCRILQVISKYERNTPSSDFGIFKLNGTTGFHENSRNRTYNFIANINRELNKDLLYDLLKNYAQTHGFADLNSSLSFAWEPEFNQPGVVDLAKISTQDTVVLVVIGYSFPFFNREIDRVIINNMKDLKKVYFQSPDAQTLIERFEAIYDNSSEIILKPIFGTDQFILPNEL